MAAEPHVLVIVLAGGEGKRLLPLTNDRAKPAVPVRRLLPPDRLRPVQLRQRPVPQDRRAHAVQEPQPRPPHQPDVAVLDAARRLRGAGAGPDAARAVLVPGLGRRDLPEPQPDPRRGPRPRVRVRRRPHLPDGSAPDGRPPPRGRRRRDGGGDPGARSTRPATSGSSRSTTPGAILAFHEKVADPPTMPGDADALPGVDGQLRVRHQDADRRSSRRATTTYTDLGGDVIPALTDAGVAHVYDFSTNVVPGQDERERGYWRDVGTIDAYYDANMDLIAPHPVFNLYNDKWPVFTYRGAEPPAKVSRGPGRRAVVRRRQPAVPGVDRVGRPRRALDHRPRRATSTTTPTSPTRSCSRASASAPAPGCTVASSTRTSRCRRGSASASTAYDRERFTVSDGRHHRHREGPQAHVARSRPSECFVHRSVGGWRPARRHSDAPQTLGWGAQVPARCGDDGGEGVDVVAADDDVAEAELLAAPAQRSSAIDVVRADRGRTATRPPSHRVDADRTPATSAICAGRGRR